MKREQLWTPQNTTGFKGVKSGPFQDSILGLNEPNLSFNLEFSKKNNSCVTLKNPALV